MMNKKWSVYESNRHHKDKERSVKTTLGLIWWIMFGKPKYIVTINRMQR